MKKTLLVLALAFVLTVLPAAVVFGADTATAKTEQTSSSGSTAGTTVSKVKLQTPQLVSAASAGYNAIKVTWKPVPGAESYILYYRASTSKYWKRLKTGITGTSYTHTATTALPLTTGKKYTFTVKAVAGKTVSGCNTTGITAMPLLATVKLGKVQSVAYNKLKITWGKVSGATGYYVYRKSGSTWKKIAVTSGTSYTHISSASFPVTTGMTYTYTVKAYREIGSRISRGGCSKTGISGKTIPNTPALVSAVCNETGKITITWKKAAGASHYLIYRKDAAGKWVKIAAVTSDKLSYTHISSAKFPIKTGTTYTYTVRSYTRTGKTMGLYRTVGLSVKAVNTTEAVDKALKTATTAVLSRVTNSSMTKSQKLRACWNYVVSGSNFSYWPKYPDTSKTGWQRSTALDMLTTRRGNCYSFACAFAALASEIGYSPTVVNGRVSGSRDGASDGLTRHCWVMIGGLYYDPEAQYAGWYRGVYGSSSYDVYHTILSRVTF